MARNITAGEFANCITTRLLMDKLSHGAIREEFRYEEILSNTIFAANEILRELECEELWVRKRGNRAYVMYNAYHRILCELGVVADKQPNGMYRRPRIVLINLRGIIPDQQDIQTLMDAVASRGVRKVRRYVK